MKKRWFAGLGAIAVTIGLGSYLIFHVDAQGVLTGLEEKVSEKVQEEQGFQILEIVPDGGVGEMGYLVKASDQDMAEEIMDAYLTEYLKEDETRQNTSQTRQEYVTAYEKSLGYALGTSTTTPLTKIEEYQEMYFPEDTKEWKILKFSEDNYETVSLSGGYQRDEKNGEYAPNITGFCYNNGGGEYKITFTDTMRTDKEELIYQQPYVKVGTDESNGMDIYELAGENLVDENPIEENPVGENPIEENPVDENPTEENPVDENPTEENPVDENSTEENPVDENSIEENSVGENPIEENPVGENPAEANSAEEKIFYIDSVEYLGVESSEACYTAVLDELMPYSYDAENGKYSFKPDETADEIPVQIARIYYKYNLVSNDWFRTKILTSKDSDNLNIEVITIEESDLGTEENKERIDRADFIYVCGDTSRSGKKPYKDTEKVWTAIGSVVTENKVPCMIDAYSMVWKACGEYYTEGYNDAKQPDFIKENIYVCGRRKMYSGKNQCFYLYLDDKLATTTTTDVKSLALAEVQQFIIKENIIRNKTSEKLSTNITRTFLLQYIIDYSNQRKLSTKDSYHVLQIQPTDAISADSTGFELTEEVVAKWAGASEDAEIMIDSMSTTEFIGKNLNLCEEYDLIYIGACIDSFNTEGEGSEKHTVYNDERMNGLIYMHTGDYVEGNAALAGIMDVDYAGAYAFQDQEPRPYARNEGYFLHNNGSTYTAIGDRTVYEDGVLKQNFMRPCPKIQYAYDTLDPLQAYTTTEERVGDLMIYRYSGNDITYDKYQELYYYCYSESLPLVVSDELYVTASLTKKTVNGEKVDNTSNMYRLLSNSAIVSKAYSVTQAQADSKLSTYMNYIQKPQILYFDPDNPGGEMEPYTAVEVNPGELSPTTQSWMKIDTANVSAGYYNAKLGFYLDSELDKVYVPSLYLDMNADGNFSASNINGNKEIMSCVIYNADTGEEAPKDSSGNYQLTRKVRYCLEGKIPVSYKGVLAWKLEIRGTPYFTLSDIQYTKLADRGEDEVVKVLQITSQNAKGESNNLIDLSTEPKIQEYLEEARSTTGLKFEIDAIGGWDFANTLAESAKEFYGLQLPNLDYSLSEYDMLIIGFSNQYCDLYYSENPNSKYAVDAIQLFIDSGKSVIFSQDTLSYVNVSPDHPFKDVNLTDLSDEGVPKQWGYYMNNAFRNVLAMDRYGVTADTDTTLSSALQKQGALLRQQQHLTVSGADSIYDKSVTVNQGLVYSYESDSAYGEDSTGSSQGYFLTRNVSTGKLSRLRDVAFAAGTYNGSKAQAYGQTQGFTNATLNAHLVSEQKQYLNLRNDLLPESNAGRDGMVKARVTQENEGLITHYPYEIGTEFQSSETHYPYYQLYVEQDEDTDNARKGDVVVWYCLSGDAANPDSEAGKIYCNSKNDVRNNYYLYRIKNVTYTGVGHSVLDHSGKDLETKLLVNTIVSAYGAKTLNPEIKLLESSDINSAEKKYEYILFDIDDANQNLSYNAVNEGVISFYMLVKDDNFASNKRISVSFTRMTSSGEKSIGATLIDCETNREAYGSSLKEGHVYLVRIPKIIDQWERGKTEMEIKATLTSEFYYYGVQVKNQASTSFTVFKSTLFDLN